MQEPQFSTQWAHVTNDYLIGQHLFQNIFIAENSIEPYSFRAFNVPVTLKET